MKLSEFVSISIGLHDAAKLSSSVSILWVCSKVWVCLVQFLKISEAEVEFGVEKA